MAGIEACDQPLTPEKAFVVRTLLIHAYRRVQLHDPQLPVELLPTPWPGALAYELARQIYLLVYAAAEQHIDTALRREDAAAPPPKPPSSTASAGALFLRSMGRRPGHATRQPPSISSAGQ
jgi:DNA-binding transcriptional regulator PaaX